MDDTHFKSYLLYLRLKSEHTSNETNDLIGLKYRDLSLQLLFLNIFGIMEVHNEVHHELKLAADEFQKITTLR